MITINTNELGGTILTELLKDYISEQKKFIKIEQQYNRDFPLEESQEPIEELKRNIKTAQSIINQIEGTYEKKL